MTNKINAKKWLINFYKGQIIKSNKKIIDLLNKKDKYIKLENELIDRIEYVEFCKNDILEMENTIKKLDQEIKELKKWDMEN